MQQRAHNTTDAATAFPESSEEERDSTVAACTRKRCNPRLCARRWKRPSKSEILSIRLLSGLSTKQPEPGASNVSSTRFERSSLPPRSSRQWRSRRKPSDANVMRSCRVKETSRAKSIWPEEGNKIATVLNSNHQLKIPVHILNRNTRYHRILRCHEQGIAR